MNTKSNGWIVAVAAVILCLMIIIVPLLAIDLFSQSQEYHNIYTNGRFGGVTTTEKTTTLVDDSLSRYINVTASIGTGEGGQGYSWTTVNTNVTWIGTPEDPVKTLQNIRLSIYTRLDENSSIDNGTYFLTIGLHVVANQTEPTIPSDAIDHKEIIIPPMGLDISNYQYSFNCSTFVGCN